MGIKLSGDLMDIVIKIDLKKLIEVQNSYRARRTAFDELFSDRPYDTNGSGAYRWACALRRLDACDPEGVAALLREAIGC